MRKHLALTIALTAALCSCERPSPDDGDDGSLVYDIVTYEGTSENGEQSTFTYQQVDDSPIITLAGVWKPSFTVTRGQRLMLGYVTDHYGQSGTITVKSAQRTVGGEIAVSPTVPPLNGSEPLSLISAWRSGPYLNMHIQASLTTEPVTVALTLDSQSMETSSPRLFLTLEQEHNQVDYAQRTAYGSWDISDIWQPQSTKSITIVYKGGEYTIHKPIKDNLTPQL